MNQPAALSASPDRAIVRRSCGRDGQIVKAEFKTAD